MGIGRFIKNKKGYALPLVLIVIVVITILGTTLLLISMTQLKHVSIEENRMQAHYYARSGAELVMFGIGEELLELHDIPVGETSALVSNEISFNGDSLAGNITLIKVYRENNDIIIVSTGSVNGVSETLELRLGNVGEEVIRHWVRVQ